jgi:hypothetical protein
MSRTVLHGRCMGGLYPFPSLEQSTTKCVLSAIKPSINQWHEHLGHSSMVVVKRVLDENKLAFSRESTPDAVCDTCQCSKSHQLPFSRSSSMSKAPLELIYSDVWGPTLNSVSKNNYYVSFVEDFSKFTWIFLLKHTSKVFAKSQLFQTHVERLLDRKIVAMHTNWGGEYEKLNSFFTRIGIFHCLIS